VRATLRDLGTERSDLLVIGGGITGAGIARDAALRGLRVALVEAGDFGSGTSSRSSRLVHGGLRYLEHGHLHLVLESLRERPVLLRLAPHLVRPLRFVLPFFKTDRVPGWKARLGLTLYDLLAGRGNVRRHQTLGKRALLEIEPLLREPELTGGAIYYDAQCDDARLTLAVMRGAAVAGAAVANYVRVTSLIQDGTRVLGARVRDELSGEEGELQAQVVINATGPWSDAIRRMEDPGAQPILRPTKGSHMVVPQSRIGNRHAIIFTSPLDRRVMFILPWEQWTYIGTTDTDATTGPEEVKPDDSDLIYLLRSANAIYPGARLKEEDVVASWAGLRPLLADDKAGSPSLVSREHRIVRGPQGLLTIAGGKLTTFRLMARDLVDRAIKEIGTSKVTSTTPERLAEGRRVGARVPFPGGEAAVTESFRGPGLELGLSESTVTHLLKLYGGETPALHTLCRQRPELMQPLHPEHPAIAAQVVFAAQREFACTADDVLCRRIHLDTETRDHGEAARALVADLLRG
jgi:glycerol-3-phosphate dehydrogenase